MRGEFEEYNSHSEITQTCVVWFETSKLMVHNDSITIKYHSKNEKHTKSNGFFIEAGAGDGEIISNSLYFELMYKVFFVMKNIGLWETFYEGKVIKIVYSCL